MNPGRLNVGPNHSSRIESGEEPASLEDNLPNAQLFSIDVIDKEFDAIIHLLNTGYAPEDYSTWQKKQLIVKTSDYTLIVGQLYKLGSDEILRRCIFDHERQWVMAEAHASVLGGHYVGKEIVHKILQDVLWWPTIHMDTRKYYCDCNKCQRTGKPSRHEEMPLAPQITLQAFDKWAVDFFGPISPPRK